MHHPTDRIAHTTAFVTPVVEYWLEREIAQWVKLMKDRSDDPLHHERTLIPQSYISRHSTMKLLYDSFIILECLFDQGSTVLLLLLLLLLISSI